MTILVTGAAGFIGSHAASAFLARGDRVVGLDNFDPYYDPKRKRANVAEVAAGAPAGAFTMVDGDLRDRELVMRLFREHAPRAVVHLGALAGVRASCDEPQVYFDVNVSGTLNLLDAAREHGSPNVVFASTSSVYGATPRVPFVEEDTADRPLAPYPASKRSAELLAHAYHHLYGLDFTALRFFTVYGPRGRPDMLTYKLVDAIRTGNALTLFDGGRMLRDWTYVGDTVAGVVAAADRRLGYEVINLGRGEPVLVSDFIATFERLTGRKVPFVEAPRPGADVERTHANIDKAQRLLGYEPRVSVAEGAERFLAWYERAVSKP
ncbi:MAG TPA: NAD-dependent epimerase/dehydratase family protein [Polyangiaceae bacterium]